MEKLNFKVEVDFEQGRTYSVCLRGGRRFPNGVDFDLSIYTPEYWEKPKAIANIESQQQFRYTDLIPPDCSDNYDKTARTIQGLTNAMNNVYPDFDGREIVTILRFTIQ